MANTGGISIRDHLRVTGVLPNPSDSNVAAFPLTVLALSKPGYLNTIKSVAENKGRDVYQMTLHQIEHLIQEREKTTLREIGAWHVMPAAVPYPRCDDFSTVINAPLVDPISATALEAAAPTEADDNHEMPNVSASRPGSLGNEREHRSQADDVPGNPTGAFRTTSTVSPTIFASGSAVHDLHELASEPQAELLDVFDEKSSISFDGFLDGILKLLPKEYETITQHQSVSRRKLIRPHVRKIRELILQCVSARSTFPMLHERLVECLEKIHQSRTPDMPVENETAMKKNPNRRIDTMTFKILKLAGKLDSRAVPKQHMHMFELIRNSVAKIMNLITQENGNNIPEGAN